MAKLRLARFVLSFMERRMPEQLEKLKQACEEKQNARGQVRGVRRAYLLRATKEKGAILL